MFKLALVILMSLTPQYGHSETWKMGQYYYYTDSNKQHYYDISRECNKKCLAYKATKKKHGKALTESDLVGGKNPQSVLCTKIYGGSIRILKDSSENENSFCFFKDGSFISSSGLGIVE